jgi:hypothetical protein
MDSNLILSITMMASGIYSCLCFVPQTGKFLFPSLYAEGASVFQRYSLLLTGTLVVTFACYSLLVKPIFN